MAEIGTKVAVKYGKGDYHRANIVSWVDDETVEVEWLDDPQFEGSTTNVKVSCVYMHDDRRIKLGKRKATDEQNGSPKRSKRDIYAFIQQLSDELGEARKENAELRSMLKAQVKDNAIKMRESKEEINASLERFINRMEGMAEDARKADKARLQTLDENRASLESKIDGVIEFAGKSAKFNLANFKKIHEVLSKK